MELVVGFIARPHGVRGEVVVDVSTDEPEARYAVGNALATDPPDAGPLTVESVRPHHGRLLVGFEGVEDRDTAEGLIRAILWIDEDAQSATVEEDAWFDHQLVGLDVVRDGAVVGRVARVEHLPAQDLLIVRVGDDEVLVPFVKAIVPEVDIDAGRVVVTPPAGLFEDLADEPADEEPAAAQDDAEG